MSNQNQPCQSAWVKAVNEWMGNTRSDFASAWSAVRQANPALYEQFETEARSVKKSAHSGTSAAVSTAQSDAFVKAVNDHMQLTGCDFAAAWTRCQQKHADIYNAFLSECVTNKEAGKSA